MRWLRLASLCFCAAAWAFGGCSSDPASPDGSDAGTPSDEEIPETGTAHPSPKDGGSEACASCRDATPTHVDAEGSPPNPPDSLDGATTDSAVRDAGEVQDSTIPVDAHQGPADYPAGPYGTEVGDTFPYFMWQGYVSENPDADIVTAGPFADYSSDAMHSSGRAVALFHISDFDCPGCQHAARVMASGAKDIERAGGLVVEVLCSHGFFSAATKQYLDAWVTTNGFSMTSVIDAPGHELATLNAMGIRETALVIDLSTMRIVFRKTGDLAGIDPPSLDDAFAEMYARLHD